MIRVASQISHTYNDLPKSIFSAMPNWLDQTVLAWNNSFLCIQKQTARLLSDPGFSTGSKVKDNSYSLQYTVTDKPQFIVESYARLVDQGRSQYDTNICPKQTAEIYRHNPFGRTYLNLLARKYCPL
jgi:hypothetical protein